MIRIVKGNLLRLSMPLQLRSVVDGEESVRDFVPTGPVCVLLSDGASQHRYAAVMDGNKAVIEDNGTLDLGAYNVEVYCQDEAGHNYRHKIRNAFQVVDTACEACMEAGVEFSVESHTLEGAVFASYGITEETDPTVPDWVKDITEEDIDRWNAGTEQVQADWEEADTGDAAYIRNKPVIPDVSGLATKAEVGAKADASSVYTKQEVDGKLLVKQDNIIDLEQIRAGAALGLSSYQKPNTGIPASDLASGVIPDVSGFATTDDVDNAVAGLVSAAPATLDTLKELADALGDDPNFATTVATALGGKVDKVTGKGLSTEDYTTAEKQKLGALPTKAELDASLADAGKVKSVTINGTKHTPDAQTGDVNLGTVVGEKGDKGDTGNVVVSDGVAQIGIINDLTTGGTGDALSAEMGKRLALLAGTYAQAWARSKAITSPFCWLWVETVNGDAISKPIWHKGNSVFVDAAGAIVNVSAAAVPDAPTITGATSGDTVPKNTQITITPASGSALYYSLDGGTTYNVSDSTVTIALTTAGSVSIVAYCANNKGNSSNATLSVTVAGTAVPTFSLPSGEVSRGGNVTISVPSGGELHYKIDSGSWITASGTSVSIPITGATTIQAYNVQDGDTSSTITNNYTMAALASPTFSVATGTELPIGGGEVALSAASGATIYYTIDGSTPTTASTQYTGAIQVADAVTIKAIAVDQWGISDVATASYTVAVDHKLQFKIALTGDNSTEYVPITNNNGPKYNMTVDWGDGTTTDYSNNGADKAGVKKDCGHTYVGNAGDEFTITIRGTRCDTLVWKDSTCCNPAALVAILDNTLECATAHGMAANDGFGANLESLSANALSNNTYGHISFTGTKLTSVPDGLLSHLTKSGYNLTDCSNMFTNLSISITASQMNELRGAIGNVTNFASMFYGVKGTVAIPDDFFDLVQAESVTKCNYMTHTAGAGLTGDAGALYNVLSTKVTSSANVTGCFNGQGLTNKTDVPSPWIN